jgi:ADP-dependent NAD(P)H-hydrate dehydratase / NAD(P)H-hydrate epimerase
MKLVSVAEMQAIEHESNERGWTYEQMMEKAGQGLAEMVQTFYGMNESQAVLGLVGSGNNGGDTLIALEVLAQMGWRAAACIVRPRSAGDPLVQRLLDAGGLVRSIDEGLDWLADVLEETGVVLDGVLGTGVRLPLKPEVARVLNFVKNFPGLSNVVAVDCPSGVDLESGAAAPETIPADLTVCMAAVKTGLLRFPAYGLAGNIEVVSIGLPEGLPSWEGAQREVVTEDWVREIMPHRSPDSHKGTYGMVGVVAGSLNYTGAVYLCSSAAYRIGAGLVQIAAPAPLHAALAGKVPEATWVLLSHDNGWIAERAVNELAKRMDKVDVLLVGPGFGLEETTAAFLRRLIEGKWTKEQPAAGFVAAARETPAKPAALPAMVVDADGLKLMAKVPDWPQKITRDSVLTPHPGEMAILTGLSIKEIQENRLAVAKEWAQKWGHIVVLKGAMTVIAAPDGRELIIPVATSALAHGGTGDVLAGLIAGLRAQGVPAFTAAAAGAWIHAQSALVAAEQIGHEASVMAGDLIEALPEVLAWIW